MAKSRCTVKLHRSRFGVEAVLMHRGASINLTHLPKNPGVAMIRRARKRLLAGCAEMIKLTTRRRR